MPWWCSAAAPMTLGVLFLQASAGMYTRHSCFSVLWPSRIKQTNPNCIYIQISHQIIAVKQRSAPCISRLYLAGPRKQFYMLKCCRTGMIGLSKLQQRRPCSTGLVGCREHACSPTTTDVLYSNMYGAKSSKERDTRKMAWGLNVTHAIMPLACQNACRPVLHTRPQHYQLCNT